MTRFSDGVQAASKLASEEARAFGHPWWGSEHLLLALTQVERDDPDSAAGILARLDVTESRIRALLYRHHPPVDGQDDEIRGSGPEIGYVFTHARWIAVHLEDRVAGTRHLLLGTLFHEKAESRVLRELGVTFEDAYREATGRRPAKALTPERSVFVPVEELQGLLATLPKVLPEGRCFGWANDDELAWFVTSDDYDLDHYVQYARTLLAD